MKRGVVMGWASMGLVALTASAGAVPAQAGTQVPAPNPQYSIAKGLQITGAFRVGPEIVTLPHRLSVIEVQVPARVAAGTVQFTASVGSDVIKRVKLRRAETARGTWEFKENVAAPRDGVMHVTVRPLGKTTEPNFKLKGTYTSLKATYTPGATGPFIKLVQQQLTALHLYLPRSGVYDNGTELALDAYHRLLGWGEGHTQLDPTTVTDLLDDEGAFHVRYPQQGQHAEGDLSDQVLAFTSGSNVYWLFPISSGKPSTPTVLGNYEVYRKQPNYTSDGMYFSSFFTGGYAIHGYNPAPDYPASHGCMRLPMVDAVPAYNWIQLGDWVDTYYT